MDQIEIFKINKPINKNCKMRIKLTITLLTALWITSMVAQECTITHVDGSVQMISDGWMKDAGAEEDFIFNLEKDILIMVDHYSQRYAKGNMDEYCEASRSMIEQMKNSIPKEQWEMMVNMQKQMPIPKVEVISKGSGGSVSGYSTERFQVMVNGALYEEVWISNDNALAGPISFFRKTDEAGETIMECSSMGEDFLLKDPQSTKPYKDLESKGLVMKKVNHEFGMGEIETEVVSVDMGNIDPSEFEPPEGYESLTFIEYMNAQMDREEYD
jgi:hypothetical protein